MRHKTEDGLTIALAIAVDRGLEDGWKMARSKSRQPTKAQWLDALHVGVMHQLMQLIQPDTPEQIDA
jgi:hypothetical protein